MFFYVKRTKYDAKIVLSPQQKKILNIKNDGKLLINLLFCNQIITVIDK
jgi:hypothetical protein